MTDALAASGAPSEFNEELSQMAEEIGELTHHLHGIRGAVNVLQDSTVDGPRSAYEDVFASINVMREKVIEAEHVIRQVVDVDPNPTPPVRGRDWSIRIPRAKAREWIMSGLLTTGKTADRLKRQLADLIRYGNSPSVDARERANRLMNAVETVRESAVVALTELHRMKWDDSWDDSDEELAA